MAIDFIIGRKVGMTRIFDNVGSDYPVTIVEAGPCPIVQVKLKGKEGYSSLQLGFIENKKSNKPMLGHFQKANIEKGTKILKLLFGQNCPSMKSPDPGKDALEEENVFSPVCSKILN
jgi:large subunit ribosomal protein L3